MRFSCRQPILLEVILSWPHILPCLLKIVSQTRAFPPLPHALEFRRKRSLTPLLQQTTAQSTLPHSWWSHIKSHITKQVHLVEGGLPIPCGGAIVASALYSHDLQDKGPKIIVQAEGCHVRDYPEAPDKTLQGCAPTIFSASKTATVRCSTAGSVVTLRARWSDATGDNAKMSQDCSYFVLSDRRQREQGPHKDDLRAVMDKDKSRSHTKTNRVVTQRQIARRVAWPFVIENVLFLFEKMFSLLCRSIFCV